MASEKKSTFYGGAAILMVGSILVKLIGAVYKIPLGTILPNEAFTDVDTAYNIYNVFLTIDLDEVKRELADYAMPKLFG